MKIVRPQRVIGNGVHLVGVGGSIPPIQAGGYHDRIRSAWRKMDQPGQHLVGDMLGTQQAALEATLEALRDLPAVPAPTTTAPTIVVGGALDALCPPEASRDLATPIPGARYIELDTGH
jgi:pimeloyl-ACP methyl ester carboxylesterase